MRKIVSITTIVFTALIIVLLTIIPHHHHGEISCVVIEQCAKDGGMNDKHPSHPTGQESSSCNLNQLKNSLYSATNHISVKSSEHFLLLALFVVFATSIYRFLTEQKISILSVSDVRFILQWVSCVLGLRAPPYYI